MNEPTIEVRVTSQLWWREPAHSPEESILRKQQQQKLNAIVAKFAEPLTTLMQNALDVDNQL